ncbi:MAG: recombinase family protein [Blautia sp.]|nr:recombinase family protein [Blautia sp.]
MAEVKVVEARDMINRGFRMRPGTLDAYRNANTAKPEKDNTRHQPAKRAVQVKPVTIAAAPKLVNKPKVAAYCRVSTLLDSQETSIESQREHYEQEIRSNEEWELAGIYLETGVSGTKAEIRPELQRMIADCKAGKIDLILTKSISRFARNTSDCLEMVRTLTALGVNIRFEKEEIDTGTMESEFMLSILACLAEDESHSISGNMKWAIRKRFEAGTYKQVIAPYGYEYRDGKLVIEPEAAAVVRRIFGMVLSGNGMTTIAKTLNGEGIPSPNGKRWAQPSLRSLIKNPAYIGDMLYQKTFKDDHFMQRVNKGELDQFYDAGHHEPIISKEDFDNAQAAVEQRGKEVGYQEGVNNNRGNNRYCFTGILICKACGCVMHRQPSVRANIRWICHRHASHPDLCRMKPQSDEDLKCAFLNCLNKLAWAQESKGASNRVLDVYETMLGKTEAEKSADRLQEIEELLEENRRESRKLTAIIMRDHFLPEHREKKAFLTKQEKELMTEKNRILISGAPSGTLQQLKSFVAGWRITDDPGAFPEETFTEFVESCTVNSQKMVTFHFRCGLELTESLYRTEVE